MLWANVSKKVLAIFLLVIVVLVFGVYKIIKSTSVPLAFSLPVPFTTQAPNGVWAFNENCEEASAIMVNAYLTGVNTDTLPVESTQASIKELVTWEQKTFGHSDNTGVDEMARFIEANFNLHTKQINNFTAYDLQSELAKHHVLILPIDVEGLGNPAYQDIGSSYHVIVVRGYEPGKFFVNDPGTDGGNNTSYSFSVLQKATADWDFETQKPDPTQKVVLSVWK